MNIIQRLKRRFGLQPIQVYSALFIIAIILYALAYIAKEGLKGLTLSTLLAAIATSVLIASVSLIVERLIKSILSEDEILSKTKSLGINNIGEREIFQIPGLIALESLFEGTHNEFLISGYSANYFTEYSQKTIPEALDNKKFVGILILHYDHLEQADQTEGRDISPQIKQTLDWCKKIINERPERKEFLKVKGFKSHFYFTGVFIDCSIIKQLNKNSQAGIVRIQLKANFKTQHEGLVLDFNYGSPYASYYADSCRKIWNESVDLL